MIEDVQPFKQKVCFPAQIIANKSGKPLAGAIVRAKCATQGDWALETDCAGKINPFLTVPAVYELEISAPGYISETRTWNLGDPSDKIILIGLEVDPNAFPNYPTRDQVCNVFCGFQGVSILTREFGWIPAFGPETSSLAEDDLISYCQQMKKLGFTHVEYDLSWRYVEPDYQYPVPGKDSTSPSGLLDACHRCEIIIQQGMFIKMSLAGDGLSVGTPNNYGYNDPQGWTYGYEWLIENLGRLLFAFTNYNGHDLSRFIIWFPGYDGVFYGWTKVETPDLQPDRVLAFGRLFRTILPDGYLGIEHTPGKIPVGEGSNDYVAGGRMDDFDTVASEFNPFQLNSDDTWQIVGRFAKPFNRPPDMPSGDDEHPDYYLHDCSRGKRFYIMYELLTYLWVRHRISIEDCNRWYDYFKAMAPNATLCMVRQ